MRKWKIMTNLLVLLCHLFLGSAFCVVNCKCDIKNEPDYENSGNTKTSTYQLYKYMFQTVGTTFTSTDDWYTLNLAGNNLNNVKLLDIIDQDVTTESNTSPSPKLDPFSPNTEPFSPPAPSDNPQPAPLCHEETQTTLNSQVITWPQTEQDKEAKSSPLCLDENFVIIKRKCEDNWEEAPICSHIQQPITSPCPPGLSYVEDKYCYNIIDKTTYPPQCPYPETIGWNEHVQLQLTKEPVWMPVTREDSGDYGIDVMRFTDLTDSYKVPYEICTQSCRIYFYSDTFMDKKCQVYHNSTHIEAVQCDQEYSALCVYLALPYRTKSFCSQIHSGNNCKQSEYGKDSPCFCEATNDQPIGTTVLAEFLLPYQNLIYTTTNSCHIGLEKTEDSATVPFIWTVSKKIIDYTNWAANVDINFDNKFGVITSDGWILETEKSENCVLYQIPTPTTQGTLQLDIEGDMFRLKIRNYASFLSDDKGEPLVYCFTDVDASSLIYRIQNFSKSFDVENSYIYKFDPLQIAQSGPGNYWCEAFLYPELRTIPSQTKTYKHYKAEYVVILKLKQYEEKLSNYPLRTENLATLQNLLKNELGNPLSFFPRIFKLNDINETQKEITITYHLSSADGINSEDEFNTLKAASMAQTIFEFVEFRSVDYCPQVKSLQDDGQIITWPVTSVSMKTDPANGFCVTENVDIIQRTCSGNFIDGAYWSAITENCSFYAKSDQTKHLLDIRNCTDLCEEALNDLFAITGNYSYFNTLDLVLTIDFLKTIADKKPDLELFAGIIDNIMQISRPTLLSSQLNFKATDLLLLSLDKALEDGDFDEYKTSNFAIKSINIKNSGIYGILLQNCLTGSSDCDLVPITNTTLLGNESFISTNKVVAAIALSSELYYQINNYSEINSSYVPKLTISIYYGSQLFVDLSTSKFSYYVFGILFPEFTEEFTGPLSIYYYNIEKENLPGYNCSYWNFTDTMFSSWAAGGTENINQAVYCEFYHITNFGIPSNLAEEYCDADKNSEENLNCSKELKIGTYNKKSFVKYQELCVPQKEINVEYDDLVSNEIVHCTLFVINTSDNILSKYCITDNATAIPTECFENFEKESYIFNITENCDIYSISHVSKRLFNITNTDKEECWNSILDTLFLYTENYINFNDLDLLIVATVMNPIAYNNPDLEKITGIVNNIMKIPTSILDSAQRNMKAIDILLHNIEEALKEGDCNEWKSENFVIKCIDINSETLGLTVENCSNNFNDCNFSPIIVYNNIYTKSDVISNTTQATISFTEDLHKQIVTYSYENTSYSPKMIVSLYSGSQLFVELDGFSTKNIFSFVFGILLPEFKEKFESPIQIYYLNDVTARYLVQYDCSYWNYNDTSFGSWSTENTNSNKTLAMCEFYHVTHFAMLTKFFDGSHLENFQQKGVWNSHRNKPFCKLKNKKNQKKSEFLNQKNNIWEIKKEPIGKYGNRSTIHNFMENFLSKIDIFSNNNFIYPTKEYYFGFLSNTIPTLSNKNTALLDRECTLTQSINFSQKNYNSLSTCLSHEKTYFNIHEKNKNVLHNLGVNTNPISNNLDTIFDKVEDVLRSLIYLNENDIDFIEILLEETRLFANINSLKRLANILNIVMDVTKNIMYKAQMKFKSADKILYFIDNILQEFETTIQIQNRNLIFLIISKEDVLNFFGFYVTKDKEVVHITNNNEKANAYNDLEIDFHVIFSSQLHEQIKANKTRLIFVIFYNDVYFPENEKSQVVKPIVEVLFPDLKENLNANFTITYHLTRDLNQFSKCSYWDHIVTTNKVVKSGSWKKEFPAQFKDNWVTCVFNHATHFALVTSAQNITTDLEDILNSNLTGLEKLQQVDTITSSSYDSLIPVDIFLISQIIGSSLTEGAVHHIISQIISNLFNVPRTVLRESQKTHTATDIILHNVDKMARMVHDTSINYQNFSLIVKNLNSVNLTGLLLHNCDEFLCTVDQLNDFINISDYAEDDTMSAMLIFSQDLVKQIKNLTINSKVIISIYYSNALFNELGYERNTTKVFGVVFPGLNTSLDGMISVVYNIKQKTSGNHQCAYWYYNVEPDGNLDNSTLGKWKNDSTRKWQGQLAICNFSHVTHFAMLLSDDADFNDNAILNIITDIGCIFSLLGMIIILLTAIFFKKWRQNTGNKILVNFSVAISLKIAMLYISEYIKSSSTGIGCTISGTILHYAILSECAWMLTIAILQFKRFVEVLGGPPKYILVKALICGWIFPFIPVICVILIDPDNYVKGNAGLCYPSHLGLYLGIWLPVIIIVSINCVIFIFIIYNVFHKKTEYIDSANYDILFQWRLALLLFFMLGLTWLFGFLGEIKGDTLFTYVFCITASLQGFVLFLFFIVFNKSTRVLYSHYAKQWFFSRRIFKVWPTKSQSKY